MSSIWSCKRPSKVDCNNTLHLDNLIPDQSWEIRLLTRKMNSKLKNSRCSRKQTRQYFQRAIPSPILTSGRQSKTGLKWCCAFRKWCCAFRRCTRRLWLALCIEQKDQKGLKIHKKIPRHPPISQTSKFPHYTSSLKFQLTCLKKFTMTNVKPQFLP